tara:strand:- start:21531 stop:21884 length:354 start_codon:yes stop_codon:yes gene_type:complete
MHNYQQLKVWQKAMDIVVQCYLITTHFPSDEKYGLSNQIKRSAVSIPSNIAEGAGRNSDNELKHFLGIANGSSNELSTQLILSHKLNLVQEATVKPLLDALAEVQKMNYKLIKKYTK